MTGDEVRALALSFPGVEAAFTLGSWNFKVGAKSLMRLGARTGPDDLMLTGIEPDEAEMLIEADPDVFHTTPHFAAARAMLARIGPLKPEVLRGFLDRRWRQIAPKAAVKAWDGR